MSEEYNDGRPIYLRLRDDLEEDILSGRLPPDGRIPSTQQLSAGYGINPMTVLRGVGLLTDEGLLYKKRGVGIFVAPDAPERLRARHQEQFLKHCLEPTIRRARQLGYTLPAFAGQVYKLWQEGQ